MGFGAGEGMGGAEVGETVVSMKKERETGTAHWWSVYWGLTHKTRVTSVRKVAGKGIISAHT